jgi:RNA recognition motif-containing protein
MTSEDLEALFTPFGAVASAKIVTDKFNNNRSKGFGFVEMANDDEARTAIAQLHDTEILGRNIVVNESTPRPEGERTFTKKPYGAGGGGNRGGGGGGYNRDRGGDRGGNGGGEYNRY